MAADKRLWKLGLYVPSELLVRDRDGVFSGTGREAAWTIRLAPVVVGPHPSLYGENTAETVTNCNDRTRYHGLYLDDFEVYAWAEQKDGARKVWYWGWQFKPGHVGRDNVKGLAHAVLTIDRRLDKITKRDGYCTSFVDFLRRIAEALKLEVAVIPTSRGGFLYSDTTHRFETYGDGLNHIAHQLRQWEEETQKAAAV